jgi:uncharacterized damage-inducible protein DinB
MTDLFDDLYAYNDWANQRVLTLCAGLTAEQLDTPRQMGFGTLRATLFHILAADEIWLERWNRVPWRPFPTDPQGLSLASISERLQQVASERRKLIEAKRSAAWSERIAYQDSKQTPYEHQLSDLLLHGANHGVHHRAQALNYLKQFGRTVVAGIDYIFYRLAEHPVEQTAEAIRSLTAHGLAVGEPDGQPYPWNRTLAQRLFQYNDWACEQVLNFAADLDAQQLDRDFQMGPGTIRKTLLHLWSAEQWWVGNWTTGPQPFPQPPAATTMADLRAQWHDLASKRNQVIARMDELEAQRVVAVLAGGPPTRFRIGESVVHLAIHATHHRAQLINMLRHAGAKIANIDLLYALAKLA